MELGHVFTDGVDIGKRRRHVDQSKVAALAESMSVIGLQQPIIIYAPDEDTADLVAGRHRLMAAIKLGWEDIACFFVNDMNELDREQCEIDENLMRSDLTPAERADHMARRKEIYEARNSVTNCDTKRGRPTGFATDTAKKTGRSRMDVHRDISRAKAIPDVAELAGTSLDSGVELDALARKSEAEKRDLARKAKAGEHVSARNNVVKLEPARHRALKMWGGLSDTDKWWLAEEVVEPWCALGKERKVQ